MFGIGLPEIILILAVALIVVGPEKLPDLAKSIAKGVVEMKKAASTLKESLREDSDDEPWELAAPEQDSNKIAEAYSNLPASAKAQETDSAAGDTTEPTDKHSPAGADVKLPDSDTAAEKSGDDASSA